MKNIFLSGLCLLFLTACTGSPSVDALLDNKDLMSEIQRAAQRDNPNKGVIPISIVVGSLDGKDLISKAGANKIRELTALTYPELN